MHETGPATEAEIEAALSAPLAELARQGIEVELAITQHGIDRVQGAVDRLEAGNPYDQATEKNYQASLTAAKTRLEQLHNRMANLLDEAGQAEDPDLSKTRLMFFAAVYRAYLYGRLTQLRNGRQAPSADSW